MSSPHRSLTPKVIAIVAVALIPTALAGCAGSDPSATSTGRLAATGGKAPACAPACRGANLAGQRMDGADLSGVNFEEANMPETTLIGANLTKANLRYANLSAANLSGANLTGARLFMADISNVVWAGATCPSGGKATSAGC